MKNNRIPLLLVIGGVVAIVLFILWAGNDFQALRSDQPPFQIRYDMYYQTRVSAQQPSTFFADRKAMRDQVPGTMPRDGYLYEFNTWQEAEGALTNPFATTTPAIRARGKNRFNAFCSPCHSTSGQDTTEVVRKGMQKPPNLAGANAKVYSDAHIFHVVSKGQNIMPGYADKLTPDDRWAVVNYVRELQKAPLKYPDIVKTTDITASDASSPLTAQGK